MDWLYVSSISIPIFATVLWLLAFNIVLWQVKDKSTPTKLLMGGFVCILAGTTSALLVNCTIANWVLYADTGYYFLSALSSLFSLQFAYHFPKKYRSREARLVLLFSCLALLALTILAAYTIYQVKVQVRGSALLFLTANTYSAMVAIWFIGVVLRQTVRLSAAHLAASRTTVETALPHAPRTARLQAAIRHLLKPGGRMATAARAFALPVLFAIPVGVLPILASQGLLNPFLAAAVTQLSVLIFLFFQTRVYLNFAPEPTTLNIKLMLGALTLVLFVLGVVGMVVMFEHEQEYLQQRLADVAVVKQRLTSTTPDANNEASLPHPSPTEIPAAVVAVIVRPPSQEDDPANFTFLYTKDDGLNLLQFTAFAASLKQRRLEEFLAQQLRQNPQMNPRQAHEEANRQVKADFYFSKLIQGNPPWAARHTDLQLFSGVLVYPVTHEARTYEVWFSNPAYRAYIHQRAAPLMWLMLGTAAFVFFVFPYLYSLSLVKPLRGLLTGVQQVNDGNLEIQAPVYYPDEIGYLAESFNTMVRSIKTAQERLLANAVKDAEREIERQKEKARLAVVEAENERRAKELEEARQLQLSLLPKTLPQLSHLEIAAYMKTATEVGGDYYDFHLASDGTLTIAVGDATGHGLKAGTLVASIKSLFVSLAYHPDIPHIFQRMSRVLKEMKLRGLFMAMTLVKVKGNQMTVSIAGMPSVLIYRAQTGAVEEIAMRALPLGGMTKYEYPQQELTLAVEDVVVLMSDGLPERFNATGEMLAEEAARKYLAEHAHYSAQELTKGFAKLGDDWGGGRPQDDDVTFVVLKVKEPDVVTNR